MNRSARIKSWLLALFWTAVIVVALTCVDDRPEPATAVRITHRA